VAHGVDYNCKTAAVNWVRSKVMPLTTISWTLFFVPWFFSLITFRVRHRWGEMYIGHGRPYVCVSVCLTLAAFPHYCTDPNVTWGTIEGALQLCTIGRICNWYRVSLMWQHSAEREMSASACTRSVPGFLCIICLGVFLSLLACSDFSQAYP